MSYEELGFGDEPGEPREVRLRTWLEVHGRVLAITVGVAVVLAGLGVGGWYRYQNSLLASPPPNVPLPPALGFEVVLCQDADVCSDAKKGTRLDVEKALAGIPEVAEFTYVTYAQSLAEARELVVDDRARPWEASDGGSIQGSVRRPEDVDTVRKKLDGVPGVEEVYGTVPRFWVGKADLFVAMCAGDWPGVCKRKAATVAQRDAVVAAFKGLDQVDEVYLEDQAFRAKLMRTVIPDFHSNPAEVLYVKVEDPSQARTVGRAVMNMPGVFSVSLVGP